MTVLILIAWRNIWRNKLRTLVVVAAIATGLSAALFAVAFTRGMVAQLVGEVVGMEVSHLLVAPTKGTPTQPSIPHAASLAEALEGIEGVGHAAARLVLPAMLSTANASAHVTLRGIDPNAEQGLTALQQRILPGQGTYFEGQTASPVIIGRRLAVDLQATLNTRIVATFRDSRGEVVSTLFRVAGIYDYQNSAFTRSNTFVLRDELAGWHGGSPGGASEIAISLEHGLPQTTQMQKVVTQWLGQYALKHTLPAVSVQTWQDLRPEVAFFYHYAGFISTLILGIILLALALVVVNTMLMVVNERRTELGVLRALGMKNSRLTTMMTLETFFMMLPGVVLSMGITAILTTWLGSKGINLTMFSGEYQSPSHDYQSIVTLVTTVYPVYHLAELIRLSIMVVVTALLSSWMPVRNALRIQPANAVKDMLPPS
jgi:putative ABC transport system permease protein